MCNMLRSIVCKLGCIRHKVCQNDMSYLVIRFSRASDALQYPKFFDKGLFGDAVGRVQWRDGNWTEKL